jgi:opacity protein-like surface antigen
MKKITLLIVSIILTLTTARSQFTKIGADISYGTGYYFHDMAFDYNKSGHLSLSVKSIYEISLPVHVSGTFGYFYPHITNLNGQKTTVSSMMFDINGHYVFNSLDKFEFYGLLGMDLLFTWKKDTYTGSETFKEKDNAPGLNLGAGTYMKLTDQFDLFLEAKYILSKYGQFMLNAGVLINIDWMIKHENTGI